MKRNSDSCDGFTALILSSLKMVFSPGAGRHSQADYDEYVIALGTQYLDEDKLSQEDKNCGGGTDYLGTAYLGT